MLNETLTSLPFPRYFNNIILTSNKTQGKNHLLLISNFNFFAFIDTSTAFGCLEFIFVLRNTLVANKMLNIVHKYRLGLSRRHSFVHRHKDISSILRKHALPSQSGGPIESPFTIPSCIINIPTSGKKLLVIQLPGAESATQLPHWPNVS